ncbi:5-beta-cholestane-3-alpha,7-alpha-diol 12-alpha-hydroxylase [Callorhinchus milii]|uniref:5-beta-cholestane-3-alpha,7-alpha-diol 12-alpha-hydroxylase n=1 Tax=Callorhinchus milii TaxID=7868 RepID=UPI001C3FB7FE|nr:5-beta-cholestane-3-alpha,7-alpha-diol 12-alpha-hydroxylase [Callorhinchus milii]
MSYLLPILLSLAALAIGLLSLLGVFRKRRLNEPPLDMGTLPWLGHVLPFRRNTNEFLRAMQKKHGDIFTVQLGGHCITFLMDPLSFGSVVKESKTNLDFEHFAKQLVATVFNYHALENDNQLLKILSNKHLMGDGLTGLSKSMLKHLQNLMLSKVGQGAQGEWQVAGLFEYSYNLLFRAGYLALFGVEATDEQGEQSAKEADIIGSEELFTQFRKYDQLFPILAYSIESPKQWLQAKRLKSFFWDLLSIKKMYTKVNISSWIEERQRQMDEYGVDHIMQNRYMFILLWASQGNTGPSSFWLLLFLLKHPEALRAVRAEVDQLVRESGQEPGTELNLGKLAKDIQLGLPTLDSAIDENLRLTTAPVLIRSVVKAMMLKMADGREYALRKGDRLALFPYLSAHINPEIHPEPGTFRYDRFLNPDGTKKTLFYKGGQKVNYYNMPWGSGVSMCPGRFFAMNELKQFIFLMLSLFDIELVNPDEEIPEIDCKRWGFGAMQPTREVQFRYRFRF